MWHFYSVTFRLFPPLLGEKLSDCYTPMSPVCPVKILLNRFHSNYSFRNHYAKKIVPSAAKTLACCAESAKSGRTFAMILIYHLNIKIYIEILRPQNVRQWLHCYDNVLISSSWGAQFERRDLYCPYLSSLIIAFGVEREYSSWHLLILPFLHTLW